MNYWTGVGSRETPEDILVLMQAIAKKLTDLGWVLRSGGAQGADSAFYAGCQQSDKFDINKPFIYLAWNGASGKFHDPSLGIYDASKFDTWEEAEAIALETRGSWLISKDTEMGRGGKALHTRNIFQVLGEDIDTPSRFLICWALPVGKLGDRSKVKGGTATATKLAAKHNVEIINLYYPEDFNRCLDFLDKYDVVHSFIKKGEW